MTTQKCPDCVGDMEVFNNGDAICICGHIELKSIIPGDNKVDEMLDKHFSKRKVKTSKMLNAEKLCAEIMADAQFHHEQFKPKKAKSYKAGFDNGWAMGYYEGLVAAANLVLRIQLLGLVKKPRIKDEDRRTLTGKELRIAGEKHLPVFYIELHSGYDTHHNYRGKCFLEKADMGYYIGHSDIDPSLWEDDDEVCGGDIDNSTFRVCAVEGVNYENIT